MADKVVIVSVSDGIDKSGKFFLVSEHAFRNNVKDSLEVSTIIVFRVSISHLLKIILLKE